MQASEFKQQFLPLSRHLFWKAWQLTGNIQKAEDLVQEVYLRLWTKRDKLDGIDNPEAYCTTLVKNMYYNQVRKKHVETVELPLEPTIANESPMEEGLEQRNACEQVMHLIGQLPEQQRKVVMLHDVEGKSSEEIHQQTGLQSTNIRVLLSRARKAIRLSFKN